VLADLTIGRDDVDHTGGAAGLDEDLGEDVGVEGRLGRGLEHDGRTRRDGGSDLQRGDEQRHVPRDDAGAHADGLAANQDRAAHGAVALLLERELAGVRGEGVEHHHRGHDLAEHREVVRRTDLIGDETGELLLASGSVVGESTLSVSFPAGSTHSPPIKNLSYVCMTSPARRPDRPGAQGQESIGTEAFRPI